MVRIAALVSAGLVVAWAALMWSVEPGNDPNGVVDYITLWESGECETEAHATRRRTSILLRSRVLDDPTQVAAIADDLVDHVADYSGA